MSVYLDTNIFLNVIYAEPEFKAGSAGLLRRIQAGDVSAVTSAVTLLEVVLDMTESGFGDRSEAAIASIEDLHALTIAPLDNAMAKTAAKHVLEDRLTVHDAYHLATALHAKPAWFVTRDRGLANKVAKHVKVATPEELPKKSPVDNNA